MAQIDSAYDLTSKARLLAPDEPPTAHTLDWRLFNKVKYDKAMPLLVESATEQQAKLEILFHLGMAHYMLGL